MDIDRMRYIIDTSSLLSLVRYYEPFDSGNEILIPHIEELFKNKLVLLKAIKEEAERVAQGKIIQKLPFLNKIQPEKDIDIITEKQHRRIDDKWCVKRQREEINNDGYSIKKSEEFKKGDFQLILFALAKKEKNNIVTIVTEESTRLNDRKLFKKIPMICQSELIRCITLPAMLKKLNLNITYTWLPVVRDD